MVKNESFTSSLKGTRNIVYMKQVNLNAVLRHNNTKFFVSHGGLGSIQESALASVPLIIVPMKSDHPHYCKIVKYGNKNIGRCLNDFTAEKVLEAMKSINDDPNVSQTLSQYREDLLMQEYEEEGDFVFWLDYC